MLLCSDGSVQLVLPSSIPTMYPGRYSRRDRSMIYRVRIIWRENV